MLWWEEQGRLDVNVSAEDLGGLGHEVAASAKAPTLAA